MDCRFGLRLLAASSLVACAAASAARAQKITLLRPSITTAVVRPDTVWFCGTLHGTDDASYYFARQTRTWGQGVSSGAGACANNAPTFGERDTIDAGRGVRIVRINAPRDRDNVPVGRSYLRVVDTARARTTDILRHLDPATLAKLPKLGDMTGDSVSTAVGGFTIDDSTLWIGLSGGFPEGEGTYGGLLRVDRRSGTVDWINDSSIVYRDIRGIADAGRWLVIGAITDVEGGLWGDPGLVRYDKTNRQWRPYGDSVPLPDKVIRTLGDDGQLIAIATENGLAVADLRRDNRSGGDDPLARWSTTWFVPTFVGDSMTYGVGPQDRAPLTQEAEAPWVFAQRYAAIGHERPFHDAIAALPPQRMVNTTFSYDDDSASAALADPSLVPMLTTMLGREQSQRLAALALARLGSRPPAGVADSLRRQFLAGGHNRPALAKALIASGDTTPLRWARSILDSAVRAGTTRRIRFDDVGNASEILADARDKVGMGLVIAIAGNVGPSMSNFMAGNLAKFDNPAAWGALLLYGSTGRLKSRDVAMVLRPSVLKDSIVHERTRAFLRANLDVDSVSFMAILAVRNIGMIELAPVIIDQLRKPRAKGAAAGMGESQALVALSGRSDAPIWADSLPPAEVHDWWQRWWESTGGKATAASPDEARQALREWSIRFFAARRRKRGLGIGRPAVGFGPRPKPMPGPEAHSTQPNPKPFLIARLSSVGSPAL